VLSDKTPYAVALTEKEKTVLRYAGKITHEQIAAAETSDTPPPYRLACQYIVRNEDILVTF
jgi:ferredoxin